MLFLWGNTAEKKAWISSGFYRFVRLTPNQILRKYEPQDKSWEPSWEKLALGVPPSRPSEEVLLKILAELESEGEIHRDPIQYQDGEMNTTYACNEHIPIRGK